MIDIRTLEMMQELTCAVCMEKLKDDFDWVKDMCDKHISEFLQCNPKGELKIEIGSWIREQIKQNKIKKSLNVWNNQ